MEIQLILLLCFMSLFCFFIGIIWGKFCYGGRPTYSVGNGTFRVYRCLNLKNQYLLVIGDNSNKAKLIFVFKNQVNNIINVSNFCEQKIEIKNKKVNLFIKIKSPSLNLQEAIKSNFVVN